MANDVAATLVERGKRYGDFAGHARYTQALKRVFQSSPNWAIMDDDQREALEMVAHKIGRILNGDPHYPDSWHDMAGYPKLVDDRLQAESKVSGTLPEPKVPASDSFREKPSVAAPTPAPAPVAPAPAIKPPVSGPVTPPPASGPVTPPAASGPVSGPVKRD